MNREILFRGKRIDNGEWVYGSLIIGKSSTCFIFDCTDCDILKDNVLSKFIQVDPKTVGQFTGYCDKNEAKIFEGDILRKKGSNDSCLWLCKFEAGFFGFYRIKFMSEGAFGFRIENEIIGNEHDNPSLLKGENGSSI